MNLNLCNATRGFGNHLLGASMRFAGTIAGRNVDGRIV